MSRWHELRTTWRGSTRLRKMLRLKTSKSILLYESGCWSISSASSSEGGSDCEEHYQSRGRLCRSSTAKVHLKDLASRNGSAFINSNGHQGQKEIPCRDIFVLGGILQLEEESESTETDPTESDEWNVKSAQYLLDKYFSKPLPEPPKEEDKEQNSISDGRSSACTFTRSGEKEVSWRMQEEPFGRVPPAEENSDTEDSKPSNLEDQPNTSQKRKRSIFNREHSVSQLFRSSRQSPSVPENSVSQNSSSPKTERKRSRHLLSKSVRGVISWIRSGRVQDHETDGGNKDVTF